MTDWLSDTLLYTGALIALVLLVRRPVARHFGPKFAYALWALPALRLLLPPIELPATLAPHSDALSDQALLAMAMAAQDMPASAPASAPLWSAADAVLAVWLAGAAAVLARRVAGYRRMRRDLLADAHTVGESGAIRLVETPAVASPVAFGVLDKVIALPSGFMAMEDRRARDLAIAHELAHHRGHDILANFAAQPLLALHWFNPLAWAGWRAMRRDQEAACDARVVEGRTSEDRVAYAHLIAGFAAGPRLVLAAPLACPIVAEKAIIHRLRSLSMSDVSTSRRWLGRALLAGGVLALPLTASISYAAQPVEPVPVPPSAPAAALPPAPPAPPLPPEAPAAPLPPPAPAAPLVERHVQRIELKHDAGKGTPGERRIAMVRSDGPLTPEQQKHLEQMRKQWEKDGAKGRQLALADVPDISSDCDKAGGQASRSWTDDKGRRHVVICERIIREQAANAEHEALMAHGQALNSLRSARATIAGNRELGDAIRREVLAELDKNIAELEAGK